MAKLTLETGVKTYDIEDEKGDLLGTISIHPSDLNIAKRAYDGGEKIQELIDGMAEINTENTEGAANTIDSIDKAIKEQLDYIFDAPVSETIFKNINSLSVSGGKYLVENFLDMILPVINQSIDEGVKASEARVKKYTDQITDNA